ncbi:gamma-type small acid-soluble spore protein [Brockia lithotrophica]|uniref:Small, acid-soluble spore protein gamma-type n=1 Tax=Brockia lithotrophica TaxID=933949 RepID=A0A660L2K8_9BACL|nr:gamma-type small acid-soluble spore protein [Brockia lithotrophica]RKQ85425.1 small acid-soluble spore protein E (minor gamma-type SASP) [Brockia lithotrophica]
MGKKTQTGTDADAVKKKNQESMQKSRKPQGSALQEFGSDTDVNQVRQQNQAAEKNKKA